MVEGKLHEDLVLREKFMKLELQCHYNFIGSGLANVGRIPGTS